MSKAPPFVRRIHCKDSGEFLNMISPRGPLFIGKEAVGEGVGVKSLLLAFLIMDVPFFLSGATGYRNLDRKMI